VAEDKRSLLAFDKFNLDVEFERQAWLYLDYAEQLAAAEAKVNQLDSLLDLKKAQLLLDIRTAPEKFRLRGKPNKEEVEAAITVHEDVQNLVYKLLRRKEEVGKLKAFVRALEHRKSAMEREADLFIAGYFAGKPRLKSKTRDAMTDRRSRAAFGPGGED
jgi:hypothetical protein